MTALALAVALASVSPSTLNRLADDVASRLSVARFEGPLGLCLEATEPPLARAVATVVCARLTQRSLSCEVLDVPLADAEALARSKGLSSLVRLSVAVDDGRLTLRGDVLETWQNFWSGARMPRGPRALALTSAFDADAEVLALTGSLTPRPPTTLELKISTLARFPAVPVALTAGDLDGDKRSELAVLFADELLVLSGEGKVLARAELSGPVTVMLREPFGAVAVSGQRVVAWSGKRARAEQFSFVNGVLKSVGAAESIVLDGVTARLEPGTNRLLPDGRGLRFPSGFQAISTRGGVSFVAWPDGSASFFRQSAPGGRLGDVGCGSALADVDGDGVPEVLASTARTVGDADELRLLTLAAAEEAATNNQSSRSLSPLWQTPLKGRVLMMTGADLDADGGDELVFGSWLADGTGELLVARRVRP